MGVPYADKLEIQMVKVGALGECSGFGRFFTQLPLSGRFTISVSDTEKYGFEFFMILVVQNSNRNFVIWT